MISHLAIRLPGKVQILQLYSSPNFVMNCLQITIAFLEIYVKIAKVVYITLLNYDYAKQMRTTEYGISLWRV